MNESQARSYLARTEWYEMVERALKQPMPDHVRKMREEAYEILQKTKERKR